jgi:predicted O-linked N-acetylglucosamine transferase (SPINDLY family)
VVLPRDRQPFWSEKIVQLPGCYQANDSRRVIPTIVPSRAECGLPETGFVFCCFNNNYKITPDIFALWLRLLEAVPGSVLWLLRDNDDAARNLAMAVAAQGLDPARLILAPLVGSEQHLARQRLADLFLDTLPYNAHTTASDALRMGLPVLTCPGESFAARVAASLLTALDMGELIAPDLAGYEALALDLARRPERLGAIRDRLRHNVVGAPLYDGAHFRIGLEAAYQRMMARYHAGLPPEGFTV